MQVVVVMNGERSKEERELQKSGLGFLKHSLERTTLDERREVLKHSLERTLRSLERTTLLMKALERTKA